MGQGSGEVQLRGWVYRERKSKSLAFIIIRDSTNIIQCVIKKETVPEDVWNDAEKVLVESSVELSGEIKKDVRAPSGYEVSAKNFKIVQLAENFPITKDQSTEFLLDKRHLWIRSRKLTAVMKVKEAVLRGSREYFYKKNWHEVTPPIITGSNCEGGSTVFEIKYFNEKAYLSQSAQLYLEALIFSLDKVFSLTPSFRAERSKTSRHLAEYWHLEGEAAWLNFEELIIFMEGLIEHVFQTVAKECVEELKILGRDPSDLEKIRVPFQKISYDEALKILKNDGIEVEWGKDLRTIEEDALMKHYDKPLVVTKYPKEVKAFYMKEDPQNPKVALCCDILAPDGYGEIIGSSERETDYEKIVEKIRNQGEKVEDYEWYLDLRKYGSVPHSGFGLGVERVVAWICKLDNIKDAIPFPRTMLRKYP
ncbi:asparagine--tRNA ligase [Candidatus Woesearchaeota archaeon]|nr:asparagine--tRNA ligase [Candidatus Woesearchaeota archaeon]